MKLHNFYIIYFVSFHFHFLYHRKCLCCSVVSQNKPCYWNPTPVKMRLFHWYPTSFCVQPQAEWHFHCVSVLPLEGVTGGDSLCPQRWAGIVEHASLTRQAPVTQMILQSRHAVRDHNTDVVLSCPSSVTFQRGTLWFNEDLCWHVSTCICVSSWHFG